MAKIKLFESVDKTSLKFINESPVQVEPVEAEEAGSEQPTNAPSGPYEEYTSEQDPDVFQRLQNDAIRSHQYIIDTVGILSAVTDIWEFGFGTDLVKYFNIQNSNGDSFTVYNIGNDVYYRDTEEFNAIKQDLEDEVPGQTIEALKVTYTDEQEEEVPSASLDFYEDCLFMIHAIFAVLTGYKFEMTDDEEGNDHTENILEENAKIRFHKVSTGGDFEKSVLNHEIENGKEEDYKFVEKASKMAQEADVPNPLDSKVEEEFVMTLPNAHKTELVQEAAKHEIEIEYEPGDKVIFNGETAAQVVAVTEDGETIDIMVDNGKVITVAKKDIQPDPAFYSELFNIDNFNLGKDKLSNLNDKPEEKGSRHKDLNAPLIGCNIVVDGFRINLNECYAYVEDIADSLPMITVIMDDGDIAEYDVNNNIEFTAHPYAVIVNAEGKPTRTITVDPHSYINAKEDELVDCEIGGRATKVPKKSIRLLTTQAAA